LVFVWFDALEFLHTTTRKGHTDEDWRRPSVLLPQHIPWLFNVWIYSIWK